MIIIDLFKNLLTIAVVIEAINSIVPLGNPINWKSKFFIFYGKLHQSRELYEASDTCLGTVSQGTIVSALLQVYVIVALSL